MATYLVTGGAGFIGSHLVERLVRDGERVRVLDNLSTGRRTNISAVADRVEFIDGDAADARVAAEAASGVDGIFHLAAISSVQFSLENPLLAQRSGEVATLTVLDAARRAGVHRVVCSSSAAVYGDTGQPSNSETLVPSPMSFYAVSKVTGETYGRVITHLYPEFDSVSLRYFNVFGPRQDPANPYSGVISIFLHALKTGTRPTIFGDGGQTRDFVEVRNVVEANLLAMKRAARFAGDVFNVGTGQRISVLQVWRHLATLAQSSLKPNFAPARPGEIRHSCASIAKIQSSLGYRPAISWQDGMAELWDAAQRTSA